MRITLLSAIFHFVFLGHIKGQLTVFNVSSSQITDHGKISAQQQFEISDQIESSTTATYGLGKGWEMGANLINVDYGFERRNLDGNTDPQFANPPTGNFSLLSCSPAINRGGNDEGDTESKDIAGNDRIFNVQIDMGAYEF